MTTTSSTWDEFREHLSNLAARRKSISPMDPFAAIALRIIAHIDANRLDDAILEWIQADDACSVDHHASPFPSPPDTGG